MIFDVFEEIAMHRGADFRAALKSFLSKLYTSSKAKNDK